MSRWYLRDRFARIALTIILSVVVVCLVVGATVDFKGFIDGTLTAIAFSGITILLGLFFVDRLIEHRREEQWAKVRLITYRGLGAHLCDVVAQVFVVFALENAADAMGQMLEGRDKPRKEALQGFAKMAEAARTAKEPMHGPTLSDQTRGFYDQVKWELEQIQTILTPRLLQSATDKKLIEALMQLDHANRALYSAILAHEQAGTQTAYHFVPEFVTAAERLYGVLLPHWLRAEVEDFSELDKQQGKR